MVFTSGEKMVKPSSHCNILVGKTLGDVSVEVGSSLMLHILYGSSINMLSRKRLRALHFAGNRVKFKKSIDWGWTIQPELELAQACASYSSPYKPVCGLHLMCPLLSASTCLSAFRLTVLSRVFHCALVSTIEPLTFAVTEQQSTTTDPVREETSFLCHWDDLQITTTLAGFAKNEQYNLSDKKEQPASRSRTAIAVVEHQLHVRKEQRICGRKLNFYAHYCKYLLLAIFFKLTAVFNKILGFGSSDNFLVQYTLWGVQLDLRARKNFWQQWKKEPKSL